MKNCMRSASICLLLIFSAAGALAEGRTGVKTATVNNVTPRRDAHGDIIDAHDGCLQFFNGRYYLYGTAYGKTAGYGFNNRFRVYSSADMEHWSFDGELLLAPPDGVYYRPYVVYNPKTRKYVLWYNWYPTLWDGKVGVAVSDTPVGPFKIVTTAAHVTGADKQPGDGSLFVDEDGTGYFIYTAIQLDHAVRIERLTEDFLDSTGAASEILGTGSEAPAMFRRGKLYYALFDTTCCFCATGSGARVFVARSPLGPYKEKGNINRDENGRPTVPAQQTFVAKIPAASGAAYIWMGDRWGSRPDSAKGHDLQYWSAPLRFAADGSIEPMKNAATWSEAIETGTERAPIQHPYAWPKLKDSHAPKVDPCTGVPLGPEE